MSVKDHQDDSTFFLVLQIVAFFVVAYSCCVALFCAIGIPHYALAALVSTTVGMLLGFLVIVTITVVQFKKSRAKTITILTDVYGRKHEEVNGRCSASGETWPCFSVRVARQTLEDEKKG